MKTRTIRNTQYTQIKRSVKDADLGGQELTAREIYRIIEKTEIDVSSAHEVATILGHNAGDNGLKINEGNPYKYILD